MTLHKKSETVALSVGEIRYCKRRRKEIGYFWADFRGCLRRHSVARRQG
jgi:hypothetical protein